MYLVDQQSLTSGESRAYYFMVEAAGRNSSSLPLQVVRLISGWLETHIAHMPLTYYQLSAFSLVMLHRSPWPGSIPPILIRLENNCYMI